MSGCRRWQISRHLRETQIGDRSGASAGTRRWHTKTDGLFVLWVLNSTTVQLVLEPLITFLDYLLQLARALLFFFFFLADVTKVCGGQAQRSHQTSWLIFTIYLIWLFFFFFSYKTIPSETRTHKMHKENCTVTFVMSGHGLNMSVVIYNGGLLSRSTTPSGSAPQPRDLRGEEGLQEESCDGDSRTKQQPIMPLYQQERAWSLCLSSPWL